MAEDKKLHQQITAEESKRNDLLLERIELEQKYASLAKKNNKEGAQYRKAIKQVAQEIRQLDYQDSQVQKDISKTVSIIEKKHRKVVALGKDKYGLESKTLKLAKANTKNLDSGMKAGLIQRDIGQEILDTNEDIISGHMSLEGIVSKRSDIQARLNDGMIVEDGIKRSLTAQEKNALKDSLDLVGTEERRLKINKQINAVKAAGKGLVDKLGTAIGMSILNPMTMAVGILELFGATQKAIGDKFGAIGVNEFRQDLVAARVEFTKMGMDAEEALSTVVTLGSEFGLATDEAAKLSVHVGDVSKSTGLAVDDSAKLLGFLTETQSLTGDQAEDLVKSTAQLAKANKVAPDAVLADIAQNTQVFAKFADKGGKNVLRAAIQAKKLGIGLDKVAGAAEGLLDFQSSLVAEQEASIMLGRQVNLQKAREAALTGDLEGMQKEILKQVGGEAQFNKMNLLQRQALAKAVGMEVDDLSKMVTKQEESVSLQGELAKQNISELVPKEVMTQMASLVASLTSMGVVFAEVLGPPLEVIIGLFTSFFGWINEIVGIMPLLIGFMISYGAVKLKNMILEKRAAGVSLKSAAADAWKGVAKMVAATGGWGTIAAIALGTAFIAAMLATMGGLATGTEMGGIQHDNTVKALHKGETVLNKDDTDMLQKQQAAIGAGAGGRGVSINTAGIERGNKEVKNEMKALRNEMKNYFGTGGSAIKGIGQKVGVKVIEVSDSR